MIICTLQTVVIIYFSVFKSKSAPQNFCIHGLELIALSFGTKNGPHIKPDKFREGLLQTQKLKVTT